MVQPWIDSDDAPELTDESFESGVWRIGDKEVTRPEAQEELARRAKVGRPKAESRKLALTVRYDAEVVEAFKSSGRGWQTRMNDALKDWLKTHSPA